MAYQDPYVNQQYPPQQREYDEPFNPYANDQPHRTYDQGGYNYDNAGYNNAAYVDDPSGGGKERGPNAYDEPDDAIPNRPTVPKTPRNLRRWRNEHNGDLWTRGGGWRTCGRFLCCTIMIFLFLIISILLSLVLWIRPPSVMVGNVGLVQNSSAVTLDNDAVTVLLDVNASVNNPNYFSIDLTDLKIDLFYPINNTAIGGGQEKNIDFRSHEQTNVTFPAALQYNITDDPNFSVLLDLAKKCGIIPGTSASDITIDYKVTVGVTVLFVPVKPTISGSTSFACPLSSDDISALLKAAGINLGDLGSLIRSIE